MSFEVLGRDLLGRIGRLETKGGVVETPVLLPVVNPAIQPISPKKMQEDFKCRALITNAYILRKHFGDELVKKGVHNFLDFNGVIMTDSGAYQILAYGNVDVTPEEIVAYQEEINTDIATILDMPTGWEVCKKYAEQTVNETLNRAKSLAETKRRNDIIWVGPVQGGQHLDLVTYSAKEMGKLPFEIHALGSPTPVMEQYLFDTLVDMILTAKMSLPLGRPLHLFGAGHPFMFSLAVALGCDLFDSAAYAIYARENRYLTEYGTIRLDELEYFPCSCPICIKNDPKDVKTMPEEKRQEMLALHNLHVSLSEVKKIKQAIIEGRLWEHLEMRVHGHPSLFAALRTIAKYREYLEKQSPLTKKSGLFFFSSLAQIRPEVVRHKKRLFERFSSPEEAKVLVLLPQTPMKPFHKSWEYRRNLNEAMQKLGNKANNAHICVYAAPFGIIPIELDEVYPLSQHETATPLDAETIDYVAKQVEDYILSTDYRKVVLCQDDENWGRKILMACRKACQRKDMSLIVLKTKAKVDATNNRGASGV